MSTSTVDHDTAAGQLSELLARKRIAAARGVLGDALPHFPDSPVLLQFAAWVDWMDDKPDEALESVRKVLEIEPESFNARLLLTRIQEEQGRFPDAELTVLGLLQDYPEEPVLYAHYARIMLQTFQFEKAERLGAEALKRDPENEDALNVHVLSGFIGSSGPEQRARLHKLIEEHPDQAQSTIRLVQLLIDDGKTRQAYELARELVILDPGNETLVDLASSLRRASHWSLLPLWPMQKWGWAGSIGIWFGVVVLFNSGLLDAQPVAEYKPAVLVVLIAYVVYSWVWPPILGRLLR